MTVTIVRLVALAALCAGLAPSARAAEDVVGPARAIDGDSLEIGGRQFNLYGIGAPELEQTCEAAGHTVRCGAIALATLTDLVAGVTVTCKPQWKEPEGGEAAFCYVDGLDLSEAMVDSGWAFAARRYCHHYNPTEEAAKADKRGVWAGTAMAPWDWRAAHPPAGK